MSNYCSRMFRLAPIVSALCFAFGHAAAQSQKEKDEAQRLDMATPDSRIETGISLLAADSRRFGQFSGFNSEGAYGLLNLNLVSRDAATGTWLKLKGKDLLQENRELRFDHERQGDWGYYLESRRLVRNEPWVVHTGLSGVGTSSLTVSSTAPKRDIDLKIERESVALGSRKFLGDGVDVRISFKQEEKDRARMYGRGTPGTMEFLAEPLNRTTRQWDVVAGYAGKKLQLSGGYGGSHFENSDPVLNVAGGAAVLNNTAANGGIRQLGLPPSNQAHQLHLAGGYNIDDGTRTSFKVSRSVALQNEQFAIPSAVNGRSSLDGRVETTLAFADLTARPIDRLDVTANVRYEDRDDQTPVVQYITNPSVAAGPTTNTGLSIAGFTGKNLPRSLQQLKETVEAGYQLDDGYRLVGSLEQEQISRNVPAPYRRVGYREKTDETQGRVELKRNLSETLNGAVAYIHSDRGGSDYVNDTYGQNASGVVVVSGAPTNQISPLIWADRRRDKLRVTGDWIPDEGWSVQFIGDLSQDHYSDHNLGPRKGTGQFISFDTTYAITEKWNVSGWISRERTTAEQTTHTDYNSAVSTPAKGVLWEAQIQNTTNAWGISLKGRPKARLAVGADLSNAVDSIDHDMARLGSIGTPTAANYGTQAPASLPNYFYRQRTLKLFADYALDAWSGVRGQFVFDHRRTTDWTWAGFVYTDGTTVSQPEGQNTTLATISYHHRWR